MKAKINRWGHTKKLLCSKGNNQQNEKAAYVLGENIYEPYF
jgi:hypothetical protein